MFTARPRLARLQKQVGLSAEERRNLQQVRGLGDRRRLPSFVDVRRDGDRVTTTDLFEYRQAVSETGASEGGHCGAIRLVERSLKKCTESRDLG